MKQKYLSKDTSINKNKVPQLFKLVNEVDGWKKGQRNLDIGSGKYDTATEYLRKFGVINYSYDPYNRDTRENISSLYCADECDSVTMSNVLCVIKEKKIINGLLRRAYEMLKPGGQVYITCYNSRKKGATQGNKSWQNAEPVEWYREEFLSKIFDYTSQYKGLIVGHKGESNGKTKRK